MWCGLKWKRFLRPTQAAHLIKLLLLDANCRGGACARGGNTSLQAMCRMAGHPLLHPRLLVLQSWHATSWRTRGTWCRQPRVLLSAGISGPAESQGNCGPGLCLRGCLRMAYSVAFAWRSVFWHKQVEFLSSLFNGFEAASFQNSGSGPLCHGMRCGNVPSGAMPLCTADKVMCYICYVASPCSLASHPRESCNC